MAAKVSAGILLFRHDDGELVVLLGHPGGPFWAKKDLGAWSIPKGELAPDEDPLTGAVREFEEETGHKPSGAFIPLAPVTQAGGKVVLAWALEGDLDTTAIESNTFSLEWPPRSGVRVEVPEIDRAEWFPISEARLRILAGQLPILDALMTETRRDHN